MLQLADAAASGLAVGLVIGRIGDLALGDNLGRPAEGSALGWRCTRNLWDAGSYTRFGGGSAPPLPGPPGSGAGMLRRRRPPSRAALRRVRALGTASPVGRAFGRVAGAHCCAPAPSEPCLRLSTAHGSSKPVRVGRLVVIRPALQRPSVRSPPKRRPTCPRVPTRHQPCHLAHLTLWAPFRVGHDARIRPVGRRPRR